MVIALAKRFFPRMKRIFVKNLVARALNPPAGKICYFRPLLHNVLLNIKIFYDEKVISIVY